MTLKKAEADKIRQILTYAPGAADLDLSQMSEVSRGRGSVTVEVDAGAAARRWRVKPATREVELLPWRSSSGPDLKLREQAANVDATDLEQRLADSITDGNKTELKRRAMRALAILEGIDP